MNSCNWKYSRNQLSIWEASPASQYVSLLTSLHLEAARFSVSRLRGSSCSCKCLYTCTGEAAAEDDPLHPGSHVEAGIGKDVKRNLEYLLKLKCSFA